MNIYELKIKVYSLKDMPVEEVQNYLAYFIDTTLVKNPQLAKVHDSNAYKYYCFDSLYPLAINKVYKKDDNYTFRVRTIDTELAMYLHDELKKTRTNELQGLTSEVKILKPHLIKKIYTLTPALLKTEQGYWKNTMKLDAFEERLKINLIKKYKFFTKSEIEEDFQLYHQIVFKNKFPVSRKYKNIKLLGDMIELEIAENDEAQKMAWLAIGTGICESNSRGFGFVNYLFY